MVVSLLLRTRTLLAAALLLSAAGAQSNTASSQLPASPARPQADRQQNEGGGLVIRQSVRRVILDVVVSDANGGPVPGLSTEDFSIAEDGKPQRIHSFDVHDFDVISNSLPKHPDFLP